MSARVPKTRWGLNPTAGYINAIGWRNAKSLLEDAAEQEPMAKRFLKMWEKSTNDQRRVNRIEKLCRDAGIAPDEFRSLLVKLHGRYTKGLARIKQAQAIPELVAVSVEAASDSDKFTERERHLEKAGIFDPQSSGVNIGINQNTLVQNQGLPSFESRIQELDKLDRNEQRQLNPASIVDAEFEEVGREMENVDA